MLSSSAPTLNPTRLWLLIAVGIAIVLVGVLTAFLVARRRQSDAYSSLAKTLPQELLAAKEEKLPLVPADLRPGSPVSPAENAAPLYYRLAEMGKTQTKKETDTEDQLLRAFLRGPQRTVAQRTEIKHFLEHTAARLSLAEQASERPRCDFARPWERGSDVELAPEYAAMRKAARLFTARAILRKDEDKPELALDDIRISARISRHAASDPVLLSLLVGCAIKMVAHRAVIEILKEYGDRAGILQRASQVHQEFEPVPGLRHAFAGEVIIGRVSMEKRRHAPNAIKELVQKYGIRVRPANDRQKQEMIDAWESRLIAYWRRVNQALRSAQGDLKREGDVFAQVQAEMESHKKQPGYETMALLTPIFTNVPAKVMQCKAHNNLQSRVIALLQYRNAHGDFPESLTLLPSAADNNDPFTNQPLLYHKTPTGFVVYSVGQNGKDDGGSEKLEAGKWPEDIIIRYP